MNNKEYFYYTLIKIFFLTFQKSETFLDLYQFFLYNIYLGL